MPAYHIIAINLGSTSTKFAHYEGDECRYKANIEHAADEIRSFSSIWDQHDYRLAAITAEIEKRGLKLQDIAAVVTRGGHTVPIEGGVYRITPLMLEQSASEHYGHHATDLGLKIAYSLSKQGPQALTADPPSTDEFGPLAHYGGMPEFVRHSRFHALNHRAVAMQYAADNGLNYAELNLVGAHMGGGITVAAHCHGRMVDATCGIMGDGPFSTNRTGTVPTAALVDMCFSGEYTKQTLLRRLNGNGGMMAYLGESDIRIVESRVDSGDAHAAEVLEAMCYQVSKELAAMGAVLHGKVNAVYLTGGIAHSRRVTDFIRERVSFLAPVCLYPGELEMQSLARNANAGLCGRTPIKELENVVVE